MDYEKKFEEDKQSLIDLIEWYRDKYHKENSTHNDLIESVKLCKTAKQLEIYERIVDDWLYY